MTMDDLRLVNKYSSDVRVDSQPAVTKKPTLWQQIKSSLGLFSAEKIIQKLHEKRTDTPPATSEYMFSHLRSLEPQANSSDKIKVLKAECRMAQSIAKACLKKPQKMSADGRQNTTAVFQQMSARAQQVELQLMRMERILELKKNHPALAEKMEQAYLSNNNALGDQIYLAAKNPKVVAFFKQPGVIKDKEFVKAVVTLLGNEKTHDIGMQIINDANEGLDKAKEKASNQMKLLDMVEKWDGVEKVHQGEIDLNMRSTPVLVKGQQIPVEKDNFDKRFGAVKIYAGERVVHGGDLRWMDGRTVAEKEAAVGKMHEVLHEALDTPVPTGLSEEQQLRLTTDVIKLSSINGLARVGVDRKMEFLTSLVGPEGMMLTSGLAPSNKTTVTIQDGVVVVKGPPVAEQLRLDPKAQMPSYYGVMVEARLNLADLQREPRLDPLPWSVESRVTGLYQTEAELMREFA